MFKWTAGTENCYVITISLTKILFDGVLKSVYSWLKITFVL